MLLLFSNLLLLLWLSLLSDKSDKGVVEGDGGDVPFCVIVVVDVEFDNVVFVCVLDGVVVVNCSFNVLTSFSAKVALCKKKKTQNINNCAIQFLIVTKIITN